MRHSPSAPLWWPLRRKVGSTTMDEPPSSQRRQKKRTRRSQLPLQAQRLNPRRHHPSLLDQACRISHPSAPSQSQRLRSRRPVRSRLNQACQISHPSAPSHSQRLRSRRLVRSRSLRPALASNRLTNQAPVHRSEHRPPNNPLSAPRHLQNTKVASRAKWRCQSGSTRMEMGS